MLLNIEKKKAKKHIFKAKLIQAMQEKPSTPTKRKVRKKPKGTLQQIHDQKILKIINGYNYTLSYTARKMGISKDSLLNLIESGTVNTVNDGKNVTEREIKRYLNSLK